MHSPSTPTKLAPQPWHASARQSMTTSGCCQLRLVPICPGFPPRGFPMLFSHGGLWLAEGGMEEFFTVFLGKANCTFKDWIISFAFARCARSVLVLARTSFTSIGKLKAIKHHSSRGIL